MSSDIIDQTKEQSLERILSEITKDDGYSLVTYIKDDPDHLDLDLSRMLDVNTFLEFIKTSQPQKYKGLLIRSPNMADTKLIDGFTQAVEMHGLLKVMRDGFRVLDTTFRAFEILPENKQDIAAMELFKTNKFYCARQFHYSKKDPKNSIDIVFLINGIPVVAIEVKNYFTGQTADDAIIQFCKDRDQSEPMFKLNRRCLVMFAVDNYEVYMTTKLNGMDTHFFPFNQGSEGPGNKGHAGNPVPPDNVATHYLFDEVLTKENLSRIIIDYMAFEDDDKSPKVIFPRYHQFHCVDYLVNVARVEGPGNHYLIQHSAGSGKSNTIAWLAYRLQNMTVDGKKVFDCVIICVHRTVLNEQLNKTFALFQYVPNSVMYVESSAELKEALINGNKVIVSTLQKFGMISESLKPYGRNFAIIFDEAHSSTTGRLNKKTKMALGVRDLTESEHEYLATKYDSEEEILKEYEKIKHEGRQDNMSFYAFTATPTEKTLHAFGKKLNDSSYDAHHHYCMQQAIEEGFICDVLEDYHTCAEYFDILDDLAKSSKISLDPKKAVKVLKDLVKKNDTVIKNKARIMVDFFKNYVDGDLNGRAKAMLVVDGRETVLLYRKAIMEVCQEEGYEGIKIMAAFSGSLDWDGESVTEQHFNSVNGRTVKSHEMADYFDTPAFNFMIAADKFQVGFDQPKLTTMFVMKGLRGVEAVQTLSRLNRVIPGVNKHTHILDFNNTREEIMSAFEPYYLDTTTEAGYDPDVIYQRRAEVEGFGVITDDDVRFFAANFKATDPDAQKRLCGLLEPSRRRFMMLTDEEQDRFRKSARSLARQYESVTVANNFLDPSFRTLCDFIHYLLRVLPKRTGDPMPDIHEMVSLDHYRLVSTGRDSIVLSQGDPLKNPHPVAIPDKKQTDYLSEIVRKLNARWGLSDFNDSDKIALLQGVTNSIAQKISEQSDLSEYADWSQESFNKQFQTMARIQLIEHAVENQEFCNNLLNDVDGIDDLAAQLLDLVHYSNVTAKPSESVKDQPSPDN